ncbi:MAG: hypothetical protein ACFFDH_24825, partial [Promethearchaeota archaeon]
PRPKIRACLNCLENYFKGKHSFVNWFWEWASGKAYQTHWEEMKKDKKRKWGKPTKEEIKEENKKYPIYFTNKDLKEKILKRKIKTIIRKKGDNNE